MPDEMEIDPPAGTKHKASSELEDSQMPKRILPLDLTVVNRIAAGEIIVSPVNGLKELIENSIDAKATLIEVAVKDGGLKFLQITDNGTGIRKDDLPILCVRHTTSKLTDFSELSSISSYGFRGEALASISHISHLAVTTRTKDSDVGWKAHYLDGELVPAKPGQSAEPKMVASKMGTQFTIEDMFFNIPIRRKAFRSPGEEYNKIIDMLGRYAIHCEGIAFSCKKQGEASSNLSIPAKAGPVDRIRQIYGALANELIEFGVKNEKWGFEANGWVTNANFSLKKTTFLLFVNHRLVESQNIKKAIEQMFDAFLPKNGRPFVYLNLEIRPDHVDVNLHPTKRMVGLIYEDEITQAICEHIQGKLAEVDHSRTFKTRQPLPAVKDTPVPTRSQSTKKKNGDDDDDEDEDEVMANSRPPPKRQRRNSNSMVRTDASLQKITKMFKPVPRSTAPALTAPKAAAPEAAAPKAVAPEAAAPEETVPEETAPEETAPVAADGEDEAAPQGVYVRDLPEEIEYEEIQKEPTPIALTSISELRKAVRDNIHEGMTQMMETHTFVGIVDEERRLAAIQGGITLYLIDYGHACYEYLYQLALTDFANFGVINFRPPLNVRRLIEISVEYEMETDPQGEDFDKDSHIDAAVSAIVSRREMLTEYFSLEVTPTGELRSLPMIVRGYTPPLAKLPQLLHNMGTRVQWAEESACLERLLREIASFYAPEELPTMPGNDEEMAREDIDEDTRTRRQNVRWAVEHIFFPAFKKRMIVSCDFAKEGMWEMANLKELYRTFERC